MIQSDDKPKATLCLLIPVFNEPEAASRLNERLSSLRAVVDECIVVDDGSTDGTASILERLDMPWVKLLRHECNRGYGAALKTGIRAVESDWVMISDCDETYPDADIPRLFELAAGGGVHMVVASRTGAEVHIPLLRRLPKFILRKLAEFLSGRRIPDLNSGMRVMRRDLVERFLHLLPDGFSFTTTITLAMMSSGYNVEFLPIDYASRTGVSKIRPVYDTLNFLQLICRTVLWFSPLRVFIPAAIALVFAGLGIHVYGVYAFNQPFDVASGITIMTGVVVLSIGMLADFIDKRLS